MFELRVNAKVILNYEPIKILALGSKIKINTLKSPFHHTVRTPKGKKITFLVGEDNPHYVTKSSAFPSQSRHRDSICNFLLYGSKTS